MATKIVKSFEEAGQVFAKGVLDPVLNAEKYFSQLGTRIDNDVQMQFRNEGAAGGVRKIPTGMNWAPFSPKTLQMPSGRFRIRYGTDKKGRPGMQGKLRKGIRRYSFSSKLLQASSGYRKSFGKGGGIFQVKKGGLVYGTNHQLRDKIGAKPYRPVLFVTEGDIERYTRMYHAFLNRGIKF